MAIDSAKLKQLILDGLPEATVFIEDLRGDGEHFSANIISPAFEGKTRVQQHKMVFDALGDVMKSELHALALQTSAPVDKK